MNAPTQKIIQEYKAYKNKIKVTPRTFAIFEYRSGLTDGVAHTQKDTGHKFGISGNRVGQLEARMKYEIEKIRKS